MHAKTWCLDLVSRLDTVPRHKAKTCLEKMPLSSAFLDTVPRPSSMKFLTKAPRPSACLGTVPQPSAMPRNDVSAK